MLDDIAAPRPLGGAAPGFAAAPSEYAVGDLRLSVARHECLLNGRPVALTPTEFSILRILLEQNGAVVSAEELCRRIWRDERCCSAANTISVHIRHLRHKLQDTVTSPRYIRTIWGVGYKIETL